jgi:hypothetical protein
MEVHEFGLLPKCHNFYTACHEDRCMSKTQTMMATGGGGTEDVPCEVGSHRAGQEIPVARFEVFTAVKIHLEVFWVVSSSGVVVGYQRFRGPRCLHIQVLRKFVILSHHYTASQPRRPRLEKLPAFR